jgi:uncharacterized protein YbjT (DUF2867 family)
MPITTVCVIGGSGFVGRHLCRQLAAQGYRVRVPTRDRERAKALILLPTVDVVVADVHDPAALAMLIKGCDAVINLVGVLHDARGGAALTRRMWHWRVMLSPPAVPTKSVVCCR